MLSTLKLSQRATRGKFLLNAKLAARVRVDFRGTMWRDLREFPATPRDVNRRAERKKKKTVSRDLDTVSESRGGLLAHIIDSRVAARDAPALLCPVERWQEAWFRDNSFLIACLIHTIRNYTAVPYAYARSRNHSGEHTREREAVRAFPRCSHARAVLFSPIFRLFSHVFNFRKFRPFRRDLGAHNKNLTSIWTRRHVVDNWWHFT